VVDFSLNQPYVFYISTALSESDKKRDKDKKQKNKSIHKAVTE